MKTLLTLALMLSTSVFASVCDMSYTFDIDEAIEAGKIVEVKKVTRNFNKAEKAMIMRVLNEILEEEGTTVAQFSQGDGVINYLKDEGKMLALVHFWPEGSESGIIFAQENGKYKRLAVIGDSHIDCN